MKRFTLSDEQAEIHHLLHGALWGSLFSCRDRYASFGSFQEQQAVVLSVQALRNYTNCSTSDS